MFKLLPEDSPYLFSECCPFNFTEGYTLPDGEAMTANEIAVILKDALITNRGLGLAAPQIGITTRAFAFGNPDDPASVMVVFNPVITYYGDDVEIGEEGCLSYPGLFIRIPRSHSIRARFADVTGDIKAHSFTGITARVFQHEYDHLDGTVFQERASAPYLDSAYRRKKKLDKKRERHAQ